MKRFLSALLSFIMVLTMTFGFGLDGYAMSLVKVRKTGQVVDSFNGVDAIYRPGGSDGSDKTYSCAALVKKYYSKIYGVTPYNLLTNATPVVYNGDSFVKVKTPRVGDIVNCANSNGVFSHWAIVQDVTDDEVVLLEQNWKWQQGGVTMAKADRSLNKNSSLRYFRLKSQNSIKEPVKEEEDQKEPESKEPVVKEPTAPSSGSTSSVSKKQSLKINYSDITLRYGKKQTCYIKGSIKNKKRGDKLSYSSSNKKIATVSSKGKITPKKRKGTCKVTVRIKGTSVKKSCIVRVRK